MSHKSTPIDTSIPLTDFSMPEGTPVTEEDALTIRPFKPEIGRDILSVTQAQLLHYQAEAVRINTVIAIERHQEDNSLMEVINNLLEKTSSLNNAVSALDNKVASMDSYLIQIAASSAK